MDDNHAMAHFMREVEKASLIETPVDFEFHLDEQDVSVASEFSDGIRIITIDGCRAEFGFEREGGKVVVEFGFGKVAVSARVFDEAVRRLRKRDAILKQMRWCENGHKHN